MNGIAAAFSATGLYYLGFAVFKLAADRMPPVRGNRIPHMIWSIVSNWIFLIALGFVLGGLTLQIIALRNLPLSTAVPIFMSGVVPLLLIALVFFGERLTGREWLSLLLIGAAILLLTGSLSGSEPISSADAPLWKIAVVVAPAVAVPMLILVLGDHRPDGRHARPITGIAYGLSSGFPVGTAELAIKGWSDDAHASSPQIAATAWPYLTVLAAAIGFGIMVMAFQRCRVSIVATVMTVAAKTYLLTMGTFLYGEPWPQDAAHSAMRLGALALGAIAVLQFPRHRPIPEEPDDPSRARSAEASASADPFGTSSIGGPVLGGPQFADAAEAGRAQPQVPPPRSPLGQDRLGQGPYDPPEGSPRRAEPPHPRRPIRPQSPTETGSDGRWRGFGE
ncbi:DMT family transporter [Actinomadura madurae]|uniref:DMT family transporter n=1 Tax=Actinomadura madurae TaxID=1993 RepID=UPI0020272BD3|nr:DMT family transporter [Actinomadura madurae]URM95097.1 DMT family transporter [Actinomadura madurae]